MNRNLKRKHVSVTVDPAGEKRSRGGALARFHSTHEGVLKRSKCLRAWVQSREEHGLILEIRKVLRQNVNAKRRRGVKEDYKAKVGKILKGSIRGETLDSGQVKSFYDRLLQDNERPDKVREGDSDTIVFFTREELSECLKHRPKGSACGVDRVSKSMLSAIKRYPARFDYVYALLNAFLLNGVPEGLKVALVSLVPKRDGARTPAEFRPISVTSLIYRLYSRLLSLRFYSAVGSQLSTAQSGYRKRVNGCSKNLAILRSVLGESRVENKSFALASVDVSKAFDSVSHVAVRECLKKLKMPDYLRNACLDTLDDNVLSFKGMGVSTKGKKGVPQGLPLSGYLFIATIDQAVKEMDSLYPYETTSGASVGALCLVDDLLVFSNNKSELELKLQKLRVRLSECGWKLNASKSYAYARVKRGTRMFVESGTVDCGGGEMVKLINSNEKFKYLGVVISGSNCLRDNSTPIVNKLKETLKRVETANLSVKNKLRAIRETIIPQQIYRLSNISSVSIWNAKYKQTTSAINRTRTNVTRLYATMDRMIMRTVKAILRIPQCGVDTSLLYVSESRGGMGLHRLEVLIPSARIKLRNQMGLSTQMQDLVDRYSFNDRSVCVKLLEKHGLSIENLTTEGRANAMILEARRSNIGKSLVIPSKRERVIPMLKRSSGLGFSSYRLQRYVRFKLNCMPTNSRKSIIDKNHSNLCRHGCGKPESLAHLMCARQCGKLKDLWVNRHNKIRDYLFAKLGKLKKSGSKLARELGCGNHQPDLILFTDKVALVLEIAVTWGSGPCLNKVYEKKRNKYSTPEATSEILSKLGELFPSESQRKVTVIPLIFAVHGSFYDPGSAMHRLYALMTASRLKAALMVSAQMATEQSLKYLGEVLGDRGLYSNTRIIE